MWIHILIYSIRSNSPHQNTEYMQMLIFFLPNPSLYQNETKNQPYRYRYMYESWHELYIMYINQQIHVFTIIYRNAHLDFVNECTKNRKIEEEQTTNEDINSIFMLHLKPFSWTLLLKTSLEIDPTTVHITIWSEDPTIELNNRGSNGCKTNKKTNNLSYCSMT